MPDTPDYTALVRYGVTWPTTTDMLHSPMPDGYWTPWHIADAALRAAHEAGLDQARAELADMQAEYRALAAAAYQMAGACGAPQRWLDALADIAAGKPVTRGQLDRLLPVTDDEVQSAAHQAGARQALEGVQDWQPIETAPTDGTQVDLWVTFTVGPASRHVNCWRGTNGVWMYWAIAREDGRFPWPVGGTPTHWMAVPSPPAQLPPPPDTPHPRAAHQAGARQALETLKATVSARPAFYGLILCETVLDLIDAQIRGTPEAQP